MVIEINLKLIEVHATMEKVRQIIMLVPLDLKVSR